MIRRNPKLQVFAVHDATPAGCRLAYRLASDPDWFGGRIKVVNVGLRPGHATKLRGLFREGGDGDADAGEGITEVESRWLSRYTLELAAFRPELILKAPFPGDPPSHQRRRPTGPRDPPRRVHLQPRSDPGSSGLLRISDGLEHPVPAAATAGPSAGRPPRVIQAPAGPPLGSDSARRRAVGPIGGLVGRADPAAFARLVEALGPGAKVLGAGPSAGGLIVDWDCCWLDGRPLRGLPDWDAAAGGGRLASVNGAFVLARLTPDGALTLARDAIGERTLYYAPLPGGLLFASTIRTCWRPGSCRAPSPLRRSRRISPMPTCRVERRWWATSSNCCPARSSGSSTERSCVRNCGPCRRRGAPSRTRRECAGSSARDWRRRSGDASPTAKRPGPSSPAASTPAWSWPSPAGFRTHP